MWRYEQLLTENPVKKDFKKIKFVGFFFLLLRTSPEPVKAKHSFTFCCS